MNSKQTPTFVFAMANFFSILKDIQQRKFHPVYVLHGNESYFIDRIVEALEQHVLNESEKAFNQTILYGKEVDFKQVVDSVSRVPMMAEYNLVMVKEAQSMRTLKELVTYIQKPFNSSVLVLIHKHKKLDMRTAFGKAVKANALVFEAKSLYDNQVPQFVDDMVKSKGYQIHPDALLLLTDYLGADLNKINNELAKLFINLKSGEEIGLHQIEENIGISKEFNVFELQKALAAKDRSKATRIFQYFRGSLKSTPLLLIINVLFSFYKKLLITLQSKGISDRELMSRLGVSSPYFLKEFKGASMRYSIDEVKYCIEMLATYDLRSKGVNNWHTAQEELLVELMMHLLEPKRIPQE